MLGRPLLYLLLVAALSLALEQRKLHHTKDGYLRTINPDSDDAELLDAEASGHGNKKQNKSDTEEKVKTLSQQVADGKYGLIQKELFSKPPKRPGVLSYEENPEVYQDNADNLGGLDQNEIWLAENHLLVLRGGKYPPPDTKHDNIATLWPPIDNYKAKLHQVKIPARPKVPPPFPVQLTEDGPLQILGTNSTRTINASDATSLYSLSPSDGAFFQQEPYGQAPDPDKANVTAGPVAMPLPFNSSGHYGSGMLVSFPLNGTLPPLIGYLPPGAVVIPPPNNQTDLYDDDDPSIYYPPPYSFFYPKDNSSAVPPGPLVPGIILPPPPNFFTLLEETTTPKTTSTFRKPQRQRKPTTTQINAQIRPTTTSGPPTTEKPVRIYPVKNSFVNNEIDPTVTKTTTPPKVVTVVPDKTYLPRQKSRKRPEGVTILRPVKPPLAPPTKVYTYENEISNKPFARYGPPSPTSKKRITVTTTQLPLKYYTTSNNIDTNPHQAENNAKTTVRPAQYFYYEEPPSKPVTSPRRPNKPSSYLDSTEQYYVQPKPPPTPRPRPRRPQYIYVTGRPYNTQKPKFRFIQQPVRDTFSVHIAQLQKQINHYITTVKTTRRPSPRPVYQYSFEAANYQQQHESFRPSPPELDQNHFRPVPVPKYNVEIQQAIEIIPSTEAPRYRKPSRPVFIEQTTERPNGYYSTSTQGYNYDKVTQKAKYVQNIATPRPVSQYSFDVTPNPIYQGYYTKPDEGFFDDNTKHYFTMFGKKLPAVTTPLPNVEITPSIELSYSQLQQGSYRQPQKPISLEGDTYVNYANPKPTINPEAEFVPVKNNNRPDYPKVVRYTARPTVYLPQREEPSDQNPEIIKAIPIEVPTSDGDGSFISYQLPGDQGAHFYFLTPQLAERKDQGTGYFYSQPTNTRIRRNDKNINDKNR